ncbi:40S ribosomal protein S11 [Astathelohania contejeani]|uniref:40S ribosomal protein S11 n=1 Tax=Astathelohania contejeani TaxID=164912 RepID=A0ABQ7HVZ1_9MICR|nr:40S ribosomal protein S11 [Thelohania contejeani]
MSDLIHKNKTFPRQEGVYANPYDSNENKTETRVWRDLEIGYKAPETAKTGTYIDKNCPFTGTINVRGRVFKGQVYKAKQENTIVVIKRYLHYIPKYKRYERRNTKYSVHLSPCFFGMVNVGDTVVCGETRPISKTKRYVVIATVSNPSKGGKYKVL